MIEYCESKVCPGYFSAIVDNVVVASWTGNRWIDRGVYRPFREKLATKVEWQNKPYDLSLLFSLKQLEIVKETGREAVGLYDD